MGGKDQKELIHHLTEVHYAIKIVKDRLKSFFKL